MVAADDVINPETGEVWVSPVFSRIFGAAHDGSAWSVDRILAHTHEDERAGVGVCGRELQAVRVGGRAHDKLTMILFLPAARAPRG
jgi:hypothetical protein